jgi:hypothetical protein
VKLVLLGLLAKPELQALLVGLALLALLVLLELLVRLELQALLG